MLHYRLDGGSFETIPIQPLGGDLYKASLPPMQCEDVPEFYVSAECERGARLYCPENAPDSFRTAAVIRYEDDIFQDDFEVDLGWTESGTATEGVWERGVPAGDGEHGDPLEDFDGSGQCWLTGNAPGQSDVGWGYTALVSPFMDATAGTAPTVHYAVWYTNHTGENPSGDVLKVLVTNNYGGMWRLVDSIGPVTDTGWQERSFILSDYVTPNDHVQVCFEAADRGGESTVEAAVDAVRIVAFTCDNQPCCGEFTGGLTGNTDCDVDGKRNLADITRLIDRVYVSRDWLCCEANGNVSGDAEGKLNLTDITVLIDFVYLTHTETAACP